MPEDFVPSTFVPIDSLLAAPPALLPAPAAMRRAREPGPRPPWIKVTVRRSDAFHRLEETVREHRLATVCEEARCPNIYECWSRGTATFMLMGEVCTRHCGFCSVGKGPLAPLSAAEPAGVAESVRRMAIRHAVITSVNRDDLADGGAAHFASTIRAVRERCPETTIEVLVPDFQGDEAAVDAVLDAEPEVFAHNIETVPRLYRRVRPEARYQQSLRVLARAARRRDRAGSSGGRLRRVKSGIMVGLGESLVELRETLADLRSAGCDVATIGQYLAPTPRHLPVERFAPPEDFDELRRFALSIGFAHVESGPLVRSSYRAERCLEPQS
jgi:lipoic acid synthetase